MMNEVRFFSGTSYLRNLQGTAQESQESPFQGDSCTLERGTGDLEQEVQKLASYRLQNYVQLPLISPGDDAQEIASGCGGGGVSSGCGGGSTPPAPPSPPPTHSGCCCSGSCCCCGSHTETPKPPAPAPKPPKPSSGC